MDLYLAATSSVPDLTIDYIEVRLKSGKTVSLNWDASYVDRCSDKIDAHYVGVCFNAKSVCGKLRKLKRMRIVSVGLYSERFGEGDFPIWITEMEFSERGKTLRFENPFIVKKRDMSNPLQQLYDKFLASSRR